MMDVYLIDTTLRDGEQRADVAFSHAQRETIAMMLGDLGVPEIEVGTPAAGRDEIESIRQITRLGLDCRLTGWCRALSEDLDAAESANLRAVHFSLPVSSILLSTLGRDRPWVFGQLNLLLADARSRFDFVSVGLQDASRTETRFLIELACCAAMNGANRVRLADTVGVWDPMRTWDVVCQVHEAVPDIVLGFHGHNDLGMATANSIAAVQAGAKCVDVTINGLGERAGNAAFEEVAMALKVVFKEDIGLRTENLTSMCDFVADASNVPIAPHKAIVGKHVFRHESGIHVRAMQEDRRSYEPFAPAEVGQVDSVTVLGKHSGRAALHQALAESGIELNADQADRLLTAVRQRSSSMGRSLSPTEVLELYERKLSPGVSY
ncbi:2-isopropylmalate synthase [Planctomycetes bacterium CA13]|uniref:2-isopropylmalate synthase n=1 Tax=Novipirellula herctigrandis TaxID=2527986 RepID=A0A5C5Z7X0_9BACT|nr:2-isopropylmalate synthase [Planctomycetes bacterium CA13]